jgi:CelD/BcsL family acetyltransferase involved in cellulose biosynthesis
MIAEAIASVRPDAPRAAAPVATPPARARIVAGGELSALAPGLRDLYHASAEANPFYGPDFLLPLLRYDRALASARFLIVEMGDRLAGFLPFARERGRLPGLRAALTGLRHPFIFDGLPLMRAGREEAAWRAMLDALEGAFGRGTLRLPPSPLDAPAATGLAAALEASGRASLARNPAERAGVVAQGTLDAYMARLKGKTAGKLRRHERDLGKLGQVELRAATEGAALEQALADFVALEAGGWKGRQGTAFACDPAALAFIRAVVLEGGGAPAARIEHLTLDGKPVGACLHLVSAGYSVTFKIAYDEAHARTAPGILTALASLRGLLAERWTRRLDSGIGPDDAAGVIWRDVIPVGETLVALSARQKPGELRLVQRIDEAAETARGRARDLYYTLTSRRRTKGRKGEG